MIDVTNTEARDVWLADLQHGPRCVVFTGLSADDGMLAQTTFHGVYDQANTADLFNTKRECYLAAAHRAIRQAAKWLDEAGGE